MQADRPGRPRSLSAGRKDRVASAITVATGPTIRDGARPGQLQARNARPGRSRRSIISTPPNKPIWPDSRDFKGPKLAFSLRSRPICASGYDQMTAMDCKSTSFFGFQLKSARSGRTATMTGIQQRPTTRRDQGAASPGNPAGRDPRGIGQGDQGATRTSGRGCPRPAERCRMSGYLPGSQ